MIALTSQPVFDKALFGIRGQGYKQSVNKEKSACMYNGPNGLKCGIGHCLPEGFSTLNIERTAVIEAMKEDALLHNLLCEVPVLLLTGIQGLHDRMDRFGRSPAFWEEDMKSLAAEHSLTYTPV